MVHHVVFQSNLGVSLQIADRLVKHVLAVSTAVAINSSGYQQNLALDHLFTMHVALWYAAQTLGDLLQHNFKGKEHMHAFSMLAMSAMMVFAREGRGQQRANLKRHL